MTKNNFIPPSCIDVLFDYIPLLASGNALGNIPQQWRGQEIAIVGAGAAGVLAAHELLKMGLKPVIYEATDRIGGRLYSKRFEQTHDDVPPFAEMGAMRIPKSSRIFLHYAKKLNISCDTPFPGPGHVDSAIYFKNQLYHWAAHTNPPEPFSEIQHLWELFITQLTERLYAAWKEGNVEDVQKLWQMHLNQYEDKSFYEVLKKRSPLSTANYVSTFGSLGIGGGGFSQFFNLGFLEVLRFIVNKYFDNLLMLPGGASEFTERLYRFPVNSEYAQGALADMACLNLNTAVINIDYNVATHNPILKFKGADNVVQQKEYRAVIFTGSVAAAHLINVTGKTRSGIYLFETSVNQAIREAQAIIASKTFICTKNKFWLEHNLPRCILTDELPRTTYFLDYPQTQRGVVCMSYTWGNDAMKLHAVEPRDRIVMFKRVMEEISPEINHYLEPLNGEVLSIDWVNQKYQNGACGAFTAGSDTRQEALYFQFQSALSPQDKGVYLAGDTVSWSSGWVEGALYTSLNSVYAVAKRLGAIIPDGSPLDQDPHFYSY